MKIRLSSENINEITDAVAYHRKIYPTMRFTDPKLGTNPDHADKDNVYFSYGTPRQLNKKPRKINWKQRLNNLK